MKFNIFVMAIVLLLAGFLSAQGQTNQPCGCEDKEEMLNFLNVTQMKIQEYKFQLDLITAQEKNLICTTVGSPCRNSLCSKV
jgi:hypothetical protein